MERFPLMQVFIRILDVPHRVPLISRSGTMEQSPFIKKEFLKC